MYWVKSGRLGDVAGKRRELVQSTIMGKVTLILGGARSGKSARAEMLAAERRGKVLYVATAQALDGEMEERISRHREARSSNWTTLEAPLRLSQAVEAALTAGNFQMVLLDCITLFASNVLMEEGEPVDQPAYEKKLLDEVEALIATWRGHNVEWIIVSNEVGLGVVPATPLGRVYRDALGRANQRLASAADRVEFMTAGLVMTLKDQTAS